jgi:hypothetical protein
LDRFGLLLLLDPGSEALPINPKPVAGVALKWRTELKPISESAQRNAEFIRDLVGNILHREQSRRPNDHSVGQFEPVEGLLSFHESPLSNGIADEECPPYLNLGCLEYTRSRVDCLFVNTDKTGPVLPLLAMDPGYMRASTKDRRILRKSAAVFAHSPSYRNTAPLLQSFHPIQNNRISKRGPTIA